MPTPAGSQGEPQPCRMYWLPILGLEHRIDEGGERRALAYDDERSQQEQRQQDRQQPPAFISSEEMQQLASGLNIANRGTNEFHESSFKVGMISEKIRKRRIGSNFV